MKKSIMILTLIAAGISAQAQSRDEMRQVFADSYERALRYNDRFEAKSVLYQLIALEPQNDSLITSLAFLYLEAGQYASCVLACMEALQINPQNEGALEMSGFSYDNLGLKDKALESYEQLFIRTGDFNTLYKMAFLQYDLGSFEQAKTNADILLQRPEIEESTFVVTIADEQKEFPMKAAVYNLKGLLDQELGDPEAAKSNFETALEVAPDFEMAKNNLADLEGGN